MIGSHRIGYKKIGFFDIWELLQINCQNDNMPKVCVITGPYFDPYAPWEASQTLINTKKNWFFFADGMQQVSQLCQCTHVQASQEKLS